MVGITGAGVSKASRWRTTFLLATLSFLLSGPSLSQQPPAVTGISQVTLYADDIATSREFYVEILGWQPLPATGTQPGLRKSLAKIPSGVCVPAGIYCWRFWLCDNR